MKHTRIGVALLATSLVLALAGCSDSDGDADGSNLPPTYNGSVPDVHGGGGDGSGGGGTGDAGEADGGAGDASTDAGAAVDTGGGGGGGGDTVEPDAGAFDYPCEPLSEEACLTSCKSAGKRKCLKDWGPCVPPDEFCGNCDDDDCDGLINEGCAPNPACDDEPPPPPGCPVAAITVEDGPSVDTGTAVHLSAAQSNSSEGAIVQWKWGVQTPPGAAGAFLASDAIEEPTFLVDVAGTYLFTLDVWDDKGTPSCQQAQYALTGKVFPPAQPSVGCSDGGREGFLDQNTYTHIAACSGGWTVPGITPASVVPACGRQAGDDSGNPDGNGCASADLCADGWHICHGWGEVAAKSPSGCAGATPADAKPKSLIFAISQPSENGSVCGKDGAGNNDVFGCGNLGTSLGADKGCGPLDRVLASTQPDKCGFNEAEPPHGPWQCVGGPGSDLLEGETVTKKGCPSSSCQYDGYPVANQDKGGVLCCRD